MNITPTFTALALSIAATLFPSSSIAFDNGSQTLPCDYTFNQQSGTDTCLILGSGMNQGILWVVFEVQNQRFRYYGDSETIELLNDDYEAIATYPVTNSFGQCTPGGPDADVYDFANGDRVCLYWD
ncbi:MAG: hypothetical protein AAGG51_02490 [Cyanobacteria bacterium P01_G01_bin.54]